jgi:hypothetical protein
MVVVSAMKISFGARETRLEKQGSKSGIEKRGSRDAGRIEPRWRNCRNGAGRIVPTRTREQPP